MAIIDYITNKLGEIVYPKTKTKAIYDDDGNRLDNMMNYSTEETYTGKRWIDGNKIYRKVITLELGEVTLEQRVNIILETDINKKLIEFDGIVEFEAGRAPLPYELTGDDGNVLQSFSLYQYNGAFIFSYYTVNPAYNNHNAYIIIEYTKTN